MRQKGGWEEEWGMRLMVGRMIGRIDGVFFVVGL